MRLSLQGLVLLIIFASSNAGLTPNEACWFWRNHTFTGANIIRYNFYTADVCECREECVNNVTCTSAVWVFSNHECRLIAMTNDWERLLNDSTRDAIIPGSADCQSLVADPCVQRLDAGADKGALRIDFLIL